MIKRLLTPLMIVCCLVFMLEIPFLFLSKKYSQIDISGKKVYSLSEVSEELLGSLETDITLYFLCSNLDSDIQLDCFLSRYEDESEHVHRENIDTLLRPNFYKAYADSAPSDQSIIVSSEYRSYVLDYSSLYFYYNEYLGVIPVSQYRAAYESYPEVFAQYPTTLFFAGEYYLGNAVQYVAAATLPTVLEDTGHGETVLTSYAESNLSYFGYALQTTETLDVSPNGNQTLLLNNPTEDFSDEEIGLLDAWVKGGNSLFVITSYNVSLPNLFSFLKTTYGIEPLEGLVCEGTSGYYYTYPYFVIPQKTAHAVITQEVKDSTLLLLGPGALQTSEVPENVAVSALLTTTANGSRYRFATATDDPELLFDGTCVLAMFAKTDVSSFEWVSCGMFLDETALSLTNGGNFSSFIASLNEMNQYSYDMFATDALLLSDSLNLSSGTGGFWVVFLLLLLPGAVLGGGFLIRAKRKKNG